MLAEIFLLRLEFMLHAAAQSAAARRSRFVPITLPFRFGAVPGCA